MEEKKLTDEEIAKAILQQVEYNAGIPYIDEWLKVKTVKFADILNFIYRLQDEKQVIECHGMLEGCDMVQQSVKDTAKEILQGLADFVDFETFRKGYELIKVKRKIKEIAKEKGVEVE